jgi:hypothetical protein
MKRCYIIDGILDKHNLEEKISVAIEEIEACGFTPVVKYAATLDEDSAVVWYRTVIVYGVKR